MVYKKTKKIIEHTEEIVGKGGPLRNTAMPMDYILYGLKCLLIRFLSIFAIVFLYFSLTSIIGYDIDYIWFYTLALAGVLFICKPASSHLDDLSEKHLASLIKSISESPGISNGKEAIQILDMISRFKEVSADHIKHILYFIGAIYGSFLLFARSITIDISVTVYFCVVVVTIFAYFIYWFYLHATNIVFTYAELAVREISVKLDQQRKSDNA